jgi:hypothetical protein
MTRPAYRTGILKRAKRHPKAKGNTLDTAREKFRAWEKRRKEKGLAVW